MKYLVVGATGLMGDTFMRTTPDAIGVDEKTLDIISKEQINDYFEKEKEKFDTVINFAAFTNVDGAEAERGNEDGLVWRLNVEGPKFLAEAAKKYDKFLIHISTDFVFEGTKEIPGPYSEEAEAASSPDRLGWYGWTKNRAEVEVMKANPDASVVRTAYPFRVDLFAAKKDYAHGIISLFEEDKLYPMFTDQKLTVTFLEDQIEALKKLAGVGKGGIYHVVNSGVTTPHEFASYLLEKYAGKRVKVEEGLMEEFLKAPGRTPRPRLGGLETKKTERVLGMEFRSWKEAVDEFIEKLGRRS